MVLSLIVSLLTARYLGPSNYGLINYAAAYVAFFTSLCTLGINSVIIKDFVDNPEEQGVAIGTTLCLRACSSFLSAITIVAVVSIADAGESITIAVAALNSISLIFHIFDTFNYWFQSRYQSKVTSIATLIAYIVTSAYKVILLVMGKDVRWFAFASSVDYIIIAILLILAYYTHDGQPLSFSKSKAVALLSKSRHYIISGMMVALYGQTDKLMLKQMLGETEVGYYAAATALNNMWVFVLAAVIDSVYPTIMRLHGKDQVAFERKNRQLYAIVFYLSVTVSLGFVLLGRPIVTLLYGQAYLPAVAPLTMITWYTAFSYLGVARNAWIVCENKQKYLKYMYLCAAVLNVCLNWVLIPGMRATGAALASLITQICTSIILPLAFREMRPNAKLMLEAIRLKGVFEKNEADK